jgi:LRR receptor-like serine/threonine-protein kinase FLS2
MTGQLPVDLSFASCIKVLSLASNKFQGPIPDEYGSMPALEYLDLSSNDINGSFPDSLSQVQSLKVLKVSNNTNLEFDIVALDVSQWTNLLSLSLENITLVGGKLLSITF